MRIVIDLQSTQGISRNRGIGRYSLNLSKAIIHQAKNQHEIYLVLNANSIESIDSVRTAFDHLIPQKQIKVFEVPKNISGHDHRNYWRIQAAEKIREHFLANLYPDIVYISSPFEGWIDNAPISIGKLNYDYLTVATLYDLIPFIYPDHYIKNSDAPDFFMQKMQFLKQADLILTISNSASKEAIEFLFLPDTKIINCSVGIDQKFKTYEVSKEEREKIKKKYGIIKEFIFYIGGLDFRKNVINLIESFSLLASNLRKKYQLVIIVTIAESTAKNYLNIFRDRYKLRLDEVIFISYVEENELIALYNLCSLFVFPSLHEGFGLPIIEAMACGAPVISSNTSSMPEATGCPEALFDPTNPSLIAKTITEVLTNENFRLFLKSHGIEHAKKFTWENTAQKTLNALETLYENKKIRKNPLIKTAYYKKKLAFISPLPPEKTGISEYSAQLLPELACFYEIIIITNQASVDNSWLNANFVIKDINWFNQRATSFDIILYQFGNSSFHHTMLDLLDVYPGIVVLHDFFLSGLFHWTDVSIPSKKNIFYRALFSSHGFGGLAYYKEKGRDATMQTYPCNLPVLSRALGVITHSRHAINLAEKWYGPNIIQNFILIPPPHLSKNIPIKDKQQARKILGFNENDFLICSFGSLHPNKLNHRLISSCLNNLMIKKNYHLIFIGERYQGNYDEILLSLIKKHKLKNKIYLKGFLNKNSYTNYLLSADIAVQLRTDSRGETSASLLNCLSYGIPTITNAHGSSSEIPNEAIIKINDSFTDEELALSINRLYEDSNLCKKLSTYALSYIKEHHSPAETGEKYYKAIENFYINNDNFREQHLIKNLAKSIEEPTEEDLISTAIAISTNRQSIRHPQLLIDISAFHKNDKIILEEPYKTLLLALLNFPPKDFRVLPIYYNSNKNKYYYAAQLIAKILELQEDIVDDIPIEIYSQDILLILSIYKKKADQLYLLIKKWQAKAVKNYSIISHRTTSKIVNITSQDSFLLQENLKKMYELSNGFIYLENSAFQIIISWLHNNLNQHHPIKIGLLEINKQEEINLNLTKLVLEDNWSNEGMKSTKTCDLFLAGNPIKRKIYIGNKEYAIEGEVRYLDYAGNPFDPSFVSLLNSFCQDNYQVLDLGANIGLTAIALANTCRNGKVIAIEPLPNTFEILRKNIKKTGLQNIYLYNFGVGNKESQVMMQAHGDFLAGAFVADAYQAHEQYASSITVPIKSLDKIFEQLEMERVDFIKMDLEGYELFALEGSKTILKKFKPTVYLEMNHWCLNVFYRISLPEFRERLFSSFPHIFAIEPTEEIFYLDFSMPTNFHHIAHEHLIKFKYCNLIAGFNKDEMIKNLNSMRA